MSKVFLSLLLVLTVTGLYGCEGWELPDWLQFSKSPAKTTIPVEPVKGTTLVSIDERVITLEDFNNRVQAFNQGVQASPDLADSIKEEYLIKTEAQKKQLLQQMVERELLIAEALERGLDQDQDVKQAIKTLKEQLLFAQLIEDEKAKVNVSPKEVEDYYNLYKEALTIPGERRVSMIVVPGEARAKELLIQLLQGTDFASLARANSTDPSAANGGDIGFIVRKMPFPQEGKKTMFAKFEEMAFSAELNQPSTVFKGDNGFYIIKVTEIKEPRERLLSEVYNDIEQGLLLQKQNEALQTLLGNLKEDANIITHEELLQD